LPLYAALKDKEVNYVTNTILDLWEEYKA